MNVEALFRGIAVGLKLQERTARAAAEWILANPDRAGSKLVYIATQYMKEKE